MLLFPFCLNALRCQAVTYGFLSTHRNCSLCRPMRPWRALKTPADMEAHAVLDGADMGQGEGAGAGVGAGAVALGGLVELLPRPRPHTR